MNRNQRQYDAGHATAIDDARNGRVTAPSPKDAKSWSAGYVAACDELRASLGPDWQRKARVAT